MQTVGTRKTDDEAKESELETKAAILDIEEEQD